MTAPTSLSRGSRHLPPDTATDPHAAPSAHAAPGAPGRARLPAPALTLRGAVASEWIKLRSLRSTVVLLLTAFLALVGIGAFMAVGIVVSGATPAGPATADPLGGSLSGLPLAELILAVLGALAVTGEYASGTIHATLTAVPRRVPVLLAKALVVASTVFAVTLAAALLAFLAAQAVLRSGNIPISLSAPGVLRALAGTALYLAGVSVIGMAFGWLVRSTAGALGAVFGVLYLLPVVGMVLPAELGDRVLPYLPGNAGAALLQIGPSALLPPWAGFAVFSAYAALLLAAAALVLRRRDA